MGTKFLLGGWKYSGISGPGWISIVNILKNPLNCTLANGEFYRM